MSKKLLKIFFLNDEDGFSARDFLLIFTTGIYFILFIYCIISLIMTDGIPTDAFRLFDSTETVVITVIGGTMSVVGIEKIVAMRRNKSEESEENKPRKETYDDI